jgi:hypothetical protein
MKSIFHLAFNVSHRDQTRCFYGAVLACPEGRARKSWGPFFDASFDNLIEIKGVRSPATLLAA